MGNECSQNNVGLDANQLLSEAANCIKKCDDQRGLDSNNFEIRSGQGGQSSFQEQEYADGVQHRQVVLDEKAEENDVFVHDLRAREVSYTFDQKFFFFLYALFVLSK